MLHYLILVFVWLTMVMATKRCPPQCSCYDSADLVDCRARGLTHVPHGIPHGSWLLDLSWNEIPELRSRSFTGVWALKVLLLSNCGIKAMQSNVSACFLLSEVFKKTLILNWNVYLFFRLVLGLNTYCFLFLLPIPTGEHVFSPSLLMTCYLRKGWKGVH